MQQPKRYVFVGERPSRTAENRRWTWTDGRLAAKQLFDGLTHCGIDPTGPDVRFANIYLCHDSQVPDRYVLTRLRNTNGWTVVGMGAKVQKTLDAWSVPHVRMIHPAARGRIRKKERWLEYVSNLFGTKETNATT